MINAENKLAGTVIIPDMDAYRKLGWTPNRSQKIMPTKYGSFICGNRAVTIDDGNYYVTGRKGKVQVRKVDENKYEVLL